MKIFFDMSPGFYKTRLFNELYKKMEILVIYTTEYDKGSRNSDFLKGNRYYPYIQLSGNIWQQRFQAIKILLRTPYDELIVGGYDSLTCWIPCFFSKREKNAVLLESTFRETNTKGYKTYLKKYFFSRMNRVYACGTPHEKLARMFGFKRECRMCYSVGLFNTVPQPAFKKREKVKNFLFVGRLIRQKNLEWLIAQFSKHIDLNLDIIGFGVLEPQLRKLVITPNIRLLGAVDNTQLYKHYQNTDVFILPSQTETWGLVVEEALNNGTPILCSHMVGSADDLVVPGKTGEIFELGNERDFEDKLYKITNINYYNQLRKYISSLDFNVYEEKVINAFLN